MRVLKNALGVTGVTSLLLRQRGSPLILMYHGVTALACDERQNWCGKHVPLELFRDQLRILRRHRQVIPLQEMIEGLRSGDKLYNTVAITFDDGYENNYSNAARILSDYQLPATFFLTTGLIGTDQWMWTDQVENMFATTLATSVAIDGIVQPLIFHSLSERRVAVRTVKQYLKKQSMERCLELLASIKHLLRVSESLPTGDYKFMDWGQVKKLVNAGFEIGAHTVNHPILSRITLDIAKEEILASRDRIIAETGSCSATFCYPNGKAEDFTPEISDFCQGIFRGALSTKRGPARSSELYELRRLGIDSETSSSDISWMLLLEN